MINSRNLKDLLPCVQERAEKFITAARSEGIDILITSTYRDKESQDALFAQGRTAPGRKVTNAKGGQSFHNHRCAFDFVPLVLGKPAWADTALFERCGVLGEQCGLVWAGRWTTFKEMAHMQYTGGLTLADLQAGRKIT